MKRFKKVAVALLSSALMASPLLTSCSGETNNDASSSEVTVRAKSIAITKQPTKLDYESGDIFDPTGMEVTATMTDGTTKVVTDYTYSKTPLTTSDTRVKIAYQGKTAYVSINVTFVRKATSIVIEENPTKTTYVVGEKFDPTGMKVVGMMNDNTKEVITDYDYDKKDALTLSDTVVTITYGNLKTTLVIKVEEEKMSSIEITKKPAKLAYVVGEKFDKTGMEISGVTQSGKKSAIELSEVTIDKDGVALTEEDKTVNVTYKDFETTLKIVVSASKLTGIRVDSENVKTTYWEGDNLSPDGLKVYAQYEDDSEKEIDIADLEFDKTKVAKGDTSVTISYGGFEKTIAIVVKEKVTTVNVDGIKTVRVEAEHLDTSKAALREDFIQYGRTFIENGDGASNGQNICGYNPGSIFEIPVVSDKDCEILITSRMSDTELNYKINDGLEFKMDNDVMTAEDVTFEFKGNGDYWNWKDVTIGKVSLKAGSHLFSIKSKTQRPNLDCFDFAVLQYGEDKAEKKLTELTIKTLPTKTVYQAGETFDPTGMVVEGKYSDLTTEVITGYTIDKTGPLTEDVDKVTISYGGLTAEVKIQVGKKYTAKINSTGTQIVEAEDLDFSDLTMRSDMQAAGYSDFVVDNGRAHGGKSIERYAAGSSKLTLNIRVGETASMKFSVFAADNNNRGFDELVTVKLDDNTVTSNNPALSSASDNPYYNWQEAIFDFQDMAAGEHIITIEFTGGQPNLDYFSFYTYKYGSDSLVKTAKEIKVTTGPTKTVYLAGDTFDSTGMVVTLVYDNGDTEVITDYTCDTTTALTAEDNSVTITYGEFTATVAIRVKAALDFQISEVGTHLEEAEDADWSTLVGDSAGVGTEDNAFSSGGKSIGHIAGGYIDYMFTTAEEMTLSVTTVIAKYEAVPASSLVSFSLDGTTIAFDDVTLGKKEDGTNDWFNMKDVVADCGSIASGRHIFRINLNGGNVDCFKFNFTK